MKKIITTSLVVLALSGISAHAATETSWLYQSYDTRTGDKMAPGYILLKEDGESATLRVIAGRMNKCFSRDLESHVERTPTTTIITAEPSLRGCEKLRYAIKTDGTGGTREVWVSDKWELDTKDRVLTPIK